MLLSDFNADSLSKRRFLIFPVSQTVDVSAESIVCAQSTEFSKVCFWEYSEELLAQTSVAGAAEAF